MDEKGDKNYWKITEYLKINYNFFHKIQCHIVKYKESLSILKK